MKDNFFEIELSNKNETLPVILCNHIKYQIEVGNILPGDKLPSELEMARKMGISRIAIRESLKMLEAQDVIDGQGKKGKFVKSAAKGIFDSNYPELSKLNFDNIQHLFETKKIIDGEMVSLAAQRANEEQINNIVECYKKFNRCRDPKSRGKAYSNFFIQISSSINNSFYIHIVYTISEMIRQSLNISAEKSTSDFIKSQEITDHLKEIAVQIEEQNSQKAKESMHSHVDFISEYFLSK